MLASRLLSTLMLLQTRGRMSAPELATFVLEPLEPHAASTSPSTTTSAAGASVLIDLIESLLVCKTIALIGGWIALIGRSSGSGRPAARRPAG